MAQWSERSPFTSEAAGSILRENFLNVARTQFSTHVKRVSQHSAESRGFSLGAPVSSQSSTRNCVGTRARSASVSTQFRVSPKLPQVFL